MVRSRYKATTPASRNMITPARPSGAQDALLGQDELVLGVEADIHQPRPKQRQKPGRERNDPAPRGPAHPGRPVSFPVRTMRVTEVRDRPNERPIAAAVYPAASAARI